MFTRTKKSFQFSLITIFAALLFLGTVGINTALAGTSDTLEGKTVIKELCDNGPDKPTKRTIKSTFRFIIIKHLGNREGTDACGNGCLSPYPSWRDLDFRVDDFETNGNPETFVGLTWSGSSLPGKSGTALTKNLKSGTFQAYGDSLSGSDVGNRQMTFTGNLVTDKKTGVTQKIVGKINGHDHTANCTYVGKFKGKLVIP
jgi:hypothetical protein